MNNSNQQNTVQRLESFGFRCIREWDNGTKNMCGWTRQTDDGFKSEHMFPVASDGTICGRTLDEVLAMDGVELYQRKPRNR